jgi:hypothetical protein
MSNREMMKGEKGVGFDYLEGPDIEMGKEMGKEMEIEKMERKTQYEVRRRHTGPVDFAGRQWA